jgi:DNA polymerase III subunit delta
VTPRRSPVHLLWGEDAFLLREGALELLGTEVQAREVDGAEWQGGETADLATPSLFGEPRALLVTDGKALPDDAVRELKAYLTAPDPEAALVICVTVAERGKAPAALTKLVEPVGEVREVKVGRKDLPGWLLARAKRRSVDLAPDAASALVETLGEDPGALEQALAQLGSAFGAERITRRLVTQQFRGLGEQHIWDLCDRAFGKDLEGSMRSLRALMQGRSDGLMILGGIASRLRDLLKVRSMPDRMPPAALAKAAGLRFDWQARRYREQAQRFTLEELVALHARVTEADRALKSGASEDVVLPMLVAAIAGDPAVVPA